MITRLNEARLAKGGKPLGFLNPWIYQNAAGFNDVTLGSNPGVQTTPPRIDRRCRGAKRCGLATRSACGGTKHFSRS